MTLESPSDVFWPASGSHASLLRESGKAAGTDYMISAITEGEAVDSGIAHGKVLVALVEVVAEDMIFLEEARAAVRRD